jgi:hypothetical protein
MLSSLVVKEYLCIIYSRASITTGYRLDDQGIGVQVLVGLRIFLSPRCPDWLWGPPSLLYNGYQEMKLTAHLQLVLK